MAVVIDANWQGVVLLLGIVGLSLATVCFAIWTMKRRENVHVELGPPPVRPRDEAPTEVHGDWPTRDQH